MKKLLSGNLIKVIVIFVGLAVILFFLWKAAGKMSENEAAENLKQLETSIRKATMLCYATEGVYPPNLEYLKEHYGIQVDEKQYVVFYEIQGRNLMPNITVMESQLEEANQQQ